MQQGFRSLRHRIQRLFPGVADEPPQIVGLPKADVLEPLRRSETGGKKGEINTAEREIMKRQCVEEGERERVHDKNKGREQQAEKAGKRVGKTRVFPSRKHR